LPPHQCANSSLNANSMAFPILNGFPHSLCSLEWDYGPAQAALFHPICKQLIFITLHCPSSPGVFQYLFQNLWI
jgi:hypothetical protein